MATASLHTQKKKTNHHRKKPFVLQRKYSKLVFFFCKNLIKKNFSHSYNHMSNSQSELINWVRLHGKFNYGYTICFNIPLGIQKESICAICSKHKKSFWQDHPLAEQWVWTLACWKHHPFASHSNNSNLNKHRSNVALNYLVLLKEQIP